MLSKGPYTSGNIKWRPFILRFCASNHKSAWQPLLPSAKGLSFTLCLLLYARVKVIFTFTFFILSFGKHLVFVRSWYIYPIRCKLAWTIIVNITLEVKHWEATLWAPIFLCVRLKLHNHKYCVSVSNCRRLYDSWVCGVC